MNYCDNCKNISCKLRGHPANVPTDTCRHYVSKEEGKKFDSQKTRWELVPWAEMLEVAEIMSFGAEKYGPRSWQNLPNGRDRYTGALIRHLMAWIGGEKKDPESGKNHLAHIICNALFLINLDNKEEK